MKAVKVTYFCIFVSKNFSPGVFVLCTVMERTSLCSKIVKKVKLLHIFSYFGLKQPLGKDVFPVQKIRINHRQLIYGSLGRKSSHKREVLHKTGQNYILIEKGAEMSRCEMQSLLDYDRRQCADSSYLKTCSEMIQSLVNIA